MPHAADLSDRGGRARILEAEAEAIEAEAAEATEATDSSDEEGGQGGEGREGNEGNEGTEGLKTTTEAFEYCKRLAETQLEKAAGAPPNETIRNDARVRVTIRTLLPDALIRELFLSMARRREAWPRLRPLFGAPPFAFLLPEDASLMRATGMAPSRKNMAYETKRCACSYVSFGIPHLIDVFAREYRIESSDDKTDRLLCDTSALQGLVMLSVRIPRRTQKQRAVLMQSAAGRRGMSYPKVGEQLSLRQSYALKRVWVNSGAPVDLVVRHVLPRGAGASTAAVWATTV